MQKIWSWLGLNLGKRAGVVSIVGLLVTLALGFGITRLEFSTGQDAYLNSDEEVYLDNVDYQELFGGSAMVTLFAMDEGETVVDLFTPANIEAIRAVEEELRATDGIVAVVSPLTALEFTEALVESPSGSPADSVAGQILLGATERDPSPEAQEIRTASSLETLERINAIPEAERTFENPAWVEFLLRDNEGGIRKSLQSIFTDDTATIVTRLDGNIDIDAEGELATFVQDTTDGLDLEGASAFSTGAPVLLKNINDYLTGGMLILGAIALAVMTLILLVLFDVRWRLLPLAVILVGLVWAFGLAGYLGIPLTIVTIAGLPVMLGVGIDYAIQMHSRVEEEALIARADHPIQETSRRLGPALLVVTFDAVFAFVALRFAQVPMIRDFGLLLAVGIAVICLCSIITPLATLGVREFKSPTKGTSAGGRDYSEGRLGRLVVKLGSAPARIAPVLIAASTVVFVGGIFVESSLAVESDPVEWVNQDSEVIADLHTLEEATGSSSELGIFVESDSAGGGGAFSEESVTFIHDFAYDRLDENPDVLLTASSIVTTVSFLMEIPGATIIPPTGEEVAAAYEVAPPDLQASFVATDANALNLIFRTGPASLEERAVVVNDIRDTIDPPPGVEATPSGLAVVGVGLLENIEANRILLTYLAIGFVGLFLAVRLRSLARSLLSLVPVLIAVGATSLVAFAAGLQLSPMTAVGGPLVVAICTEFTSLILLRFVEERERGLVPTEAADVAAARTGRAFIVSALTGIAGVAVLATSSLPLLGGFGLGVAMNVAVALLSALVVLPPMLVWADSGTRLWVSKGLVPGDVLARAGADPPRPERCR